MKQRPSLAFLSHIINESGFVDHISLGVVNRFFHRLEIFIEFCDGLCAILVVSLFLYVSFYPKAAKKTRVLREMFKILREIRPGQIDTIEFRNYD